VLSSGFADAGVSDPGTFAAAAAVGLSFRPVAEADLPFLCRLYGTTRAHELAPVPWSPEQKAAFVEMQFRAQHAHYVQHYPGAEFLVILRTGVPVGRLYLARWAREHRIVDIALLPDHCGQGLGSAVLSDIMAAAARAEKYVSIHVEKHNPAMRLYRRLGFVAVEDKGVYELLRGPLPRSTDAE
jgi:ribosomal protein S18 acetylase RimI-like enzyme